MINNKSIYRTLLIFIYFITSSILFCQSILRTSEKIDMLVSPNILSDIVMTIEKNQEVKVLEKTNSDWIHVSYKGFKGYIFTKYSSNNKNANMDEEIIYSKDGVSLGKRNEFIAECIYGANKNSNPYYIDTYKYCSCIADNIMPTINSWELEKAAKENKYAELLAKPENLEIISNCLEGNYEFSDGMKVNEIENLEKVKRLAVDNCIYEMMYKNETELSFTNSSASIYCSCLFDKLFSEGYTINDLKDIDNLEGSIINEITVPCITEAFKMKSSNEYQSSDIQGGGIKSLVSLIDYFGKGYKVKIKIAGVTKYFLFDTGASDLLIDRETERELLLNGSLKKENYLEKIEYKLANNQSVRAQKIKVDNISIGDYKVSNVVIAIMDEGSLLCGKSFLDKFKTWEIDEKNKVLILYK
jgi:clan AA aspartic protease (TIGR02281 family)